MVLRPGEKLHEAMVPEDEARQTTEQEDRFVIHPSQPYWSYKGAKIHEGKACPEGFSYSSETNPDQLSIKQIQDLVSRYQEQTLD
jgi:UDP-N-acetylglucosamine 4,6-dehydratase